MGHPFVKICMAGKSLYPTDPYVSAKVRGGLVLSFVFALRPIDTHRVHGTGINILTFSTKHQPNLGGGFKHFLFSPLLGKMIKFD